MSRKIGRGALAAIAAGAMAVSLGATASSADVIDTDNPIISVPEATVGSATLHRIADADRITTAIKASQSAKWGDIVYRDWQRWECAGDSSRLVTSYQGRLTAQPAGTKITVTAWDTEAWRFVEVECEAVYAFTESAGNLDIIVATDADYPDALAAAPLADVLDAPILLNGSNVLDPRVRAEIARLAGEAGDKSNVTVHLLGGTNALSHAVENAIDGIDNVDVTLRHQGIDRYQTATSIAGVTVGYYGIESDAGLRDINTYLTTGLDFPDALSAGAAAAENDGVVLLTHGAELDRRGFTEDFLVSLRTFVDDDEKHFNTTENFAVGGPSAKAAADYDIRLAPGGAYVGVDRFETATKTAAATFDDPDHFAIVSGITFPDALVGSGFIANADGPLLLTENNNLNGFTASYLNANVDNGDTLIVFGGGNSVAPSVSAQVKALLDELFKLPEW